MYTLIVIDMQYSFEAASNVRLINNCKLQIKNAIENRATIIFLEYQDCGSIIDSLLKISDSYDQKYFISKIDDDGSYEVYDVIYRNKLPNKTIKICGVNTDCCVYHTVSGLTARIPDSSIIVLSDSCYSNYNHLVGLKNISKLRNVLIQ